MYSAVRVPTDIHSRMAPLMHGAFGAPGIVSAGRIGGGQQHGSSWRVEAPSELEVQNVPGTDTTRKLLIMCWLTPVTQ